MSGPAPAPAASLIVVEPGGRRDRVEISPLPFRIGRQPDNHLVLRDTRASRNHAQIVADGDGYRMVDLGSVHGVFVNGARVESHRLRGGDRVSFGYPDSTELVFALDGEELRRVLDHFEARDQAATAAGPSGLGGNLGKLRAVLEVARTLQASFSMHDVLTAVVDAALTVTGCERGFLFLFEAGELRIHVARDRRGATLTAGDLRVSRSVIQRALRQRRELLSMNFTPGEDVDTGQSILDLDLRSVVCVPLVRVGSGAGTDTRRLSPSDHTAGVLYLDSRVGDADLAGGNRELLQTLALEASTVVENARLLEEERAKRRIEEELEVARGIQQSLLPKSLPGEGWLRASGRSVPTHQVGGDYYDVMRLADEAWSVVVADVSGKGVSSALLASLLQGAFLSLAGGDMQIALERLNRFLNGRTGGEKYATLFYATISSGGELRYINAGHCAPIVAGPGRFDYLDPTGMPVGLMEDAPFPVEERRLKPGDKLVLYTDGVTEAQNASGAFFGRRRLRETVSAHAHRSCEELRAALDAALDAFTGGAGQADDVTLLVVQYQPSDSQM